jgi:hypothetical protein
MGDKVVIFKPYPFEVGQKIRIDNGPRKGDWEVAGISDIKVQLCCPISGQQVEWAKFCYLVEERENDQWPFKDYQ